jgi:hypothetical protein
MKKVLILLTALALVSTPAFAGTHLEKGKAQKHATKHVESRHQKKKLAKHEKKQAKRKLAKRNAKKHKVAV